MSFFPVYRRVARGELWTLAETGTDTLKCFFIVFCGFIFAQMPFSIGRHQWDVNLSQMMLFLKVPLPRPEPTLAA